MFLKNRNLLIFALVTACILMIPLVAMQFTTEVVWTLSDFIFAGVLLFVSGLVYEFASRSATSKRSRIIIALLVLAVLAFIWVGAATGFEGVFNRL